MAYDREAQLDILKLKLGICHHKQDRLLAYELDSAMRAINNRRRYTPTEAMPLEPQFYDLQIRMAIVSFNKSGAEGQTVHNENGINRSYESGDVYPKSMLREIVPLVR